MKKFNGILMCTDLDGTLLRNDKTISRENKEAIEYFKSEGGLFTFITGRMPSYVSDIYREFEDREPLLLQRASSARVTPDLPHPC